VSNANPENTALNVCARAFASSVAAPGSAAPAFKLNYRGGQEGSALSSYYNRVYTFDLHANDAKTGLALARATCAVDSNGTLISLTGRDRSSTGG
jgi:hypothetical protein